MKESEFKRIINAVRGLPDDACNALIGNLDLREHPELLKSALDDTLDIAHPSFVELVSCLKSVDDRNDARFVAFMTALRYRSNERSARVTPVCTLSTGMLPGFGRTREESLKLIDSATKSIYVLGYWLTSHVDYVIRALERATGRGVKIYVLADSRENFLNVFLAQWDSQIPFPSIYLFTPSKSRSNGNDGAKMHAKTIIVDDESMIVTSANMTHSALHENIELGVLIEGRESVTPVSKMVNSLIHDKSLFEKIRTAERPNDS